MKPEELERLRIISFLRKTAEYERKRGMALEADAGTQARHEARRHYDIAKCLEWCVEEIESGKYIK